MGRSKRDVVHIQQYEHDELSNSKRVKITDTELSIELNHADGDSVTSHPAKLTASAIDVDASNNGQEVIPALECSSMRKISVIVNGTGSVKIMVSPVDSGSFFVELLETIGGVMDICARRVKIVSVDLVGDVHLVGRS